MRRRLDTSQLNRMERNFWITAGVVTAVVLALTLLDAYFLGFR
jgi:hypothetical protein